VGIVQGVDDGGEGGDSERGENSSGNHLGAIWEFSGIDLELIWAGKISGDLPPLPIEVLKYRK
jgi:hypothetical protein